MGDKANGTEGNVQLNGTDQPNAEQDERVEALRKQSLFFLVTWTRFYQKAQRQLSWM